MDETEISEDLKSKLIIAGINEIDIHGIADFSLRRVSQACGASCAAPYRHFKNKDDLIVEIIKYINQQWQLLENQLIDIYSDNLKKLIIEICISNIRFRIANPDFSAVLMMDKQYAGDKQKKELSQMTENLDKLICKYADHNNINTTIQNKLIYTLHSFIYGAVVMITNGEIVNSDDNICMIRDCLEEYIK